MPDSGPEASDIAGSVRRIGCSNAANTVSFFCAGRAAPPEKASSERRPCGSPLDRRDKFFDTAACFTTPVRLSL